jgi:hypothetical protein
VVIKNTLAFLDLPWEPAVLNFHESGRLVFTASYDQVRKPLYTKAVGCAAHYSRHLGALRDALPAELLAV